MYTIFSAHCSNYWTSTKSEDHIKPVKYNNIRQVVQLVKTDDRYLHGSIHLRAVKHEDEVLEIPDRWLPGKKLCLFCEEKGWIQSQSHVDKFSPD